MDDATIVMQLPDSTDLGSTISAADGTFRLEQEPESFQLIVRHLFYQTKQINGQVLDAGIIILDLKDYNLGVVKYEPDFLICLMPYA